MKLRIKGDSLRLRISDTEASRLALTGHLEDAIHFAPGERLVYSLALSAGVDALTVRYDPGQLAVLVPAAVGRAWLAGDEETLKGRQEAGPGRTMSIKIEKDREKDYAPERPAREREPERRHDAFYYSSDTYDEDDARDDLGARREQND
jgi:hypothetical protein